MAGMFDSTVSGLYLIYYPSGRRRTIRRINPSDPASTIDPYGDIDQFQIPDYIGSPANVSRSIDFSPIDGKLYYVELNIDENSSELHRIEPGGVTEFVGTLPPGITASNEVASISFDESGDLYAYIRDRSLYKINIGNPSSAASGYGLIGELPLIAHSGLAFHNGSLYGVQNNNIIQINPDDPSDTSSPYGNLGQLPAPPSSDRISTRGIAISRSGEFYVIGSPVIGSFVRNESWLIRVNPSQVSDVSPPFGFSRISDTFVAVGLAFYNPPGPSPSPTPGSPIGETAWYLQLGPDSRGNYQRVSSRQFAFDYDGRIWQPAVPSRPVGDLIFDGSPPEVSIELAILSDEERQAWLAFSGTVAAEFGYIHRVEGAWRPLANAIVGTLRDPLISSSINSESVVLTIKSIRKLAPSIRSWSHVEQTGRFPGDSGFSQLKSAASHRSNWPRA